MIKKPLIIDGDPGHDDVMAVLLAVGCGQFDLKGITCVAGNCSLDKAVDNMLKVVDYLQLDIPVFAGAATPLRGVCRPAAGAHGASGMAGPILPKAKSKAGNLKAIEFIAKVLSESETPVVLAPLGPLTNIAEFMMCYPHLVCKIEQISLMGGGAMHGNVTPTAEFNFWHDPEAARIVFQSGVPIAMAGLDVTEKALVKPEDVKRFRAIGNKAGNLAGDLMDFYCMKPMRHGWAGGRLHDPVAIYWLLKPEKVVYTKYFTAIDIFGEYTRGASVVDMVHSLPGETPQTDVMFDLDREDFIDTICQALAKLS